MGMKLFKLKDLYNKDFYNEQSKMSYKSAINILSVIKPILPEINSVLDVGCGCGTWLKAWLDTNNNIEIYGIDANELPNESLYVDRKYIAIHNIERLEDLKTINKKFDLVESLEVAEHLSPNAATQYIHFLSKYTDLILFSAAIPAQSGVNHVNEQPPQYWNELFQKENFEAFDILRDGIWNNENISWWYRQNLIIYARNEKAQILKDKGYKSSKIINSYYHPDLINMYVPISGGGETLSLMAFKCLVQLYKFIQSKILFAKKIKKEWNVSEKMNFEKFKNSAYIKIINKNSICIDCGANVGRISELFAQHGATVYAFEPNPLCFGALEKITKKYSNINLIKKGVCDKNCTLKMYHNDLTNYDSEFFSQSSSICATKDNVNTKNYTEIECIDLCEFLENLNKPIDILKMDIEGAEFDILEKMINKGLYKNIKYILVETHDETIPEIQDKAKQVRKIISDNNITNINLDWI